MAATVTILNSKRLAPATGADSTEALTIVRANIALGSQSDYHVTSGVGGGLVASTFGLSEITDIRGVVRASASNGAVSGIVMQYDPQLQQFMGFIDGASSNGARALVAASSSTFTNGDVCRVIVMGLSTSQGGN